MKGAMASSAARGVQSGWHSSRRATAWLEELRFGAALGDPLQTSSGKRHSGELPRCVEGVATWRGDRWSGSTVGRGVLLKAKPMARGVVAVRHVEVETSDEVWREEDGRADLHVIGYTVARQCPRLGRWPCVARGGLLLGDDVGAARPW
jgi:hypothetical protein